MKIFSKWQQIFNPSEDKKLQKKIKAMQMLYNWCPSTTPMDLVADSAFGRKYWRYPLTKGVYPPCTTTNSKTGYTQMEHDRPIDEKVIRQKGSQVDLQIFMTLEVLIYLVAFLLAQR